MRACVRKETENRTEGRQIFIRVRVSVHQLLPSTAARRQEDPQQGGPVAMPVVVAHHVRLCPR